MWKPFSSDVRKRDCSLFISAESRVLTENIPMMSSSDAVEARQVSPYVLFIVARLHTKLKARRFFFYFHFVVLGWKWNLTGKAFAYQTLKKKIGALEHRMS